MNKKPPNYKWDKESCLEVAKKFKYRIEFKKSYPSAYSSARINGWLNDMCVHMTPKGNKNKRLIYIYKFSDNYVYVGLTGNPERRKWDHFNKSDSPVFKHIKKTLLIPMYEEVTDYLMVNESIKYEKHWTNEMAKQGYYILNDMTKIGLIGGNTIKWTKSKCKESFLECNSIKELRMKYPTSYNVSIKNNWVDEFASHIKYTPNGHWNNKNNCEMESMKYNSRTEFKEESSGAYYSSIRNNWLNDICNHMVEKRKSKNYWTKQTCKIAFDETKTKIEFKKKYLTAYRLSIKNNWIDDF